MKSKIRLYFVYGSKNFNVIEHMKAVFVRKSCGNYFLTEKAAHRFADKYNINHKRSKLYVHKFDLCCDYFGIAQSEVFPV